MKKLLCELHRTYTKLYVSIGLLITTVSRATYTCSHSHSDWVSAVYIRISCTIELVIIKNGLEISGK